MTSATAHPASGAAARAGGVFAVLSAMSLVVLDAGVVNVALPSLARALRASPGSSILVVIAYQAGLVMALLPAGALGERFGHRRVFALGVALFATASALCALAPTLPWLVAARLVQGLGGAAVMALGVALLRLIVPPDRLGAAIGWNALTVAIASAAAPTLGALVLALVGWQGLFAINLPLAAAVLVASRFLPSSPRRRSGPAVVSVALNGLAFGLMILAAEAAPAKPRLAVALLAAGIVAFVALVRREAGKTEPLLPFDLLGLPPFRLSVIASVCCFAAQSAGLLALPFLLQHELGRSPLAAGLYITVWPLAVAAAAVVAGRLADRLSTAWLCALGAGCLAAGLAGAAAWPIDGAAARLLPFIALCGAGFGLFQSPNNRNMFLAAPSGRSGAAGGLQGTARVTGQSLGALLMAMLFSLVVAEAAPRLALGLAAATAIAAGLVSLLRAAPGGRKSEA